VQRAVQRFAIDRDADELRRALWRAIPAFRNDPFGGVEVEELLQRIMATWQKISNEADIYPAVLEGRQQRDDMPFHVQRVTRAVLHWADRIAEGRLADDPAPAWPSPEEIAHDYHVSRATAYRILARRDDAEYVVLVIARAIQRQTVRQLVAQGRSKAAARRLLQRRPALIGAWHQAPPPRPRRMRRRKVG
jgi:hypothetical protein